MQSLPSLHSLKVHLDSLFKNFKFPPKKKISKPGRVLHWNEAAISPTLHAEAPNGFRGSDFLLKGCGQHVAL